MAKQLSEHWYDFNGNAVFEQPKKDGSGMRPTTIRDAKALGLLPSVTSVLKILSKDQLSVWKERMCVKYALLNPGFTDGQLEDNKFLDSIREKDGCFEAGELWKVTGKRLVKTGKRYPATCYREDDYEPGGLEGEQTHCVYSVEKGFHKSKILAAHCELTS